MVKLKVWLRVFERSCEACFCGGTFGQRGVRKPVSNGFLRCGKGTQSGLVCLAAELDSYC